MRGEGVILLVEDNADDVLAVQRAFRALKIINPLMVLRWAEHAMEYLSPDDGQIARRPFHLPDLILLDLNLPGMNGFQFLTWVRRQPELKHLAIIVITSSPYSADIRRAYQAGANSFITKTPDFSELKASLREATDFWLPRAKTPEQVGTVLEPAETVER